MILVTGATGFIGRRLCETLVERGLEVVVLSRSAERARQAVPQAKAAFAWEPTAGAPPAEAFAGVDAVLSLAGESVGQRWNEEVKRRIRDSRVVGTRNLVEGIRRAESPPRVLVSGSAVGYYGDRGEEELTEDSPAGTGFFAEVGQAWEAEALRAAELGVRVVVLRTGVVLGRNGGALEKMLPPFKMGVGGPIGNGQMWFPWIHREDVVGLIVHALENAGVSGALNATAPNPVRNKEFAQTLGRALRRPAFLPTPPLALRLAFGEFATEGLLASQRVLPSKAERTGYKFKHPTIGEALAQILG